jgi:hypothetical protein
MDANLLLWGCRRGGSDAAMDNRRINAGEGLEQGAPQDLPDRGGDSHEAIICN